MGGILSHLISLKQLERLAEHELLNLGRPQLEAFAARIVARISDEQLPHTAAQLRALADAADAKDRARMAKLIAADLEAAQP